MTRILAALALALTLPAAVLAGSHMDHSGHGMATDANASTVAYEAASARMHEDMAIELTGDADVDFARGMIPHHQGAIDMATIVLEHGDDPQLRALAEEIIAAQRGEIAVLQAWLAENAQ
jgi:uncharacterized protein (DUF305 family)